MSSKFIEPDSAVDWFTVAQLCQSSAREIIKEFPLDPKRGRIDLFRNVQIDGRTFCLRLKLSIVHVGTG